MIQDQPSARQSVDHQIHSRSGAPALWLLAYNSEIN
jgi:hypothetical protein